MITMALRLTGRRCLVIGGGAVAERRIGLFLKEGAKVTVVSPEVTANIAEWAAKDQLVWQKAAYDESVDLAADFVLLATSDSELNATCAKKARALGALVNRADDRSDCDFTFPATVTVGDLEFAIFTGRVSPRLSRLIKKDLANRYGAVAEMLPALRVMRKTVRELLTTPAEREEFWQKHLGQKELIKIIEGDWKCVEDILSDEINRIRFKS